MTDSAVDPQQQINTYWNWRSTSGDPGALIVRDDAERRIWQDTLRPLLPAVPAHVVDVGTGQGFLALLFAELGYRVTGFDLSEGMLAEARTNAGALSNPPEFRVGDAMDPPLDPGSVDLLTNRNVLWTLLDPQRAFRNWFRLVRPGGRILVLHGVPTPQDTDVSPATQHAQSEAAYTQEVQAKLPGIRNRPTLDPVLPFVGEAGFVDVQITRFVPIEEYERTEREPRRDRIWLALTAARPK
jgi:SAM-dependent methyltransferase